MKIYKYGDNVDTDVIIPARYLVRGVEIPGGDILEYTKDSCDFSSCQRQFWLANLNTSAIRTASEKKRIGKGPAQVRRSFFDALGVGGLHSRTRKLCSRWRGKYPSTKLAMLAAKAYPTRLALERSRSRKA